MTEAEKCCTANCFVMSANGHLECGLVETVKTVPKAGELLNCTKSVIINSCC